MCIEWCSTICPPSYMQIGFRGFEFWFHKEGLPGKYQAWAQKCIGWIPHKLYTSKTKGNALYHPLLYNLSKLGADYNSGISVMQPPKSLPHLFLPIPPQWKHLCVPWEWKWVQRVCVLGEVVLHLLAYYRTLTQVPNLSCRTTEDWP